MKKSVIAGAAGLLVLAAAGGYYGIEIYPQQRFRAGLDQTLAALPYHATATYKDAHYSLLSRQAVVTGLTIHADIPGSTPQKIDMTFDTVETSDPNLDLARSWNNSQADKAAVTPDTVIPVAGSIAIKGISIHSTTFTMTQASFEIDKPRFYPWALLQDGMPTMAQVQTITLPSAGPPDLVALQPLLRVEAALMLSLAYDGYKAEQTSVEATAPGMSLTYDVARTTGGGFDRGILAGGSAEGISGKGTTVGGTISLDRLGMGQIDIRAPATRIAKGEPIAVNLLDGVKMAPFSYEGLSIQAPGKPPIHLDSLTIGPMAFSRGKPVSATLSMRNLVLAKALFTDPRGQDAFNKLGLDTMTVSFALSYDWNLDQKRLAVRDTTLKVNELGTLALSADLTNVVEHITPLTPVGLAHAKFRFEDASLTERLLRAGAAQAGTDPTAYRQQMIDTVRQRSQAAGDDSPALAAGWQAVGDFIQSPHSLTVELSPPTPMPLIALRLAAAVPGRLAALLGLSVTANKP
jgi:hypothetical protein